MSQTTFVDVNICDLKSVTKLKVADFDNNNLITTLFAIDIDKNRIKNKKDEKTTQTNTAKRTNIPNKIFNYIHIAQCKRVFSLI